jgi:hypothetical protein
MPMMRQPTSDQGRLTMPKGKTGPKVHATGHRIRIGGRGPYVRADLHAMLETWRSVYGVPLGRSLDAALDLAKNTSNFRLPLKGARTITEE